MINNPPLNDTDLINLKQELTCKISELKTQIDNLYLDIKIIDNYFNDKKELLNFKYSFHSLNINNKETAILIKKDGTKELFVLTPIQKRYIDFMNSKFRNEVLDNGF